VDKASAAIKERTTTMPRTHRNYDNGFRQEAVNLLLSGAQPLKRVAAELGISANSLRNWRDRALGKGRAAQADAAQPPGRSGAPLADAAGEIRRLQREVEYLRRQREILKKAMSILSEDPPSAMR
jgi:transposase-like protein